MIDYKKIGKRIQKARYNKELTQERLAEKAGITPVYVSQLERGAKQPSLSVLIHLAEALDISIEWLLTGNPRSSNDCLNCILNDCTEKERIIINKVATTLKAALRSDGNVA